MLTRIWMMCAALMLAAGCAATDDTAETGEESNGGGNGGRGDLGGNDNDEDEDNGTPGGGADAGGSTDAGAPDGGFVPDTSGAPDGGGGGGGGGGGACSATTLDAAINCQIASNNTFVNAYCDCFTDAGYEGDRAACIADQPQASAFQPAACARAALLQFESAAVANSVCYAAVVDDLAECFRECPPTEADFNACFDAVDAGFNACDATLPAGLEDALAACEDSPVEPPSDVAAALALLDTRQNDYITQYCTCYAAAEYPDFGTCVSALETRWNPGQSSCERNAFSDNPAASLPFINCLGETFLIGETACTECPMTGSLDADICSDLSVDINFCFADADPALQDTLIACNP